MKFRVRMCSGLTTNSATRHAARVNCNRDAHAGRRMVSDMNLISRSFPYFAREVVVHYQHRLRSPYP